MNLAEIIGFRIRQRRTALGYSQEQLAEYSDLYPTYIGQLERGEKTPSIDTLYKVTTGLNVTLSDFLSGIEVMKEPVTDSYSFKSYQLIERQSIPNQEHLYYILEQILKMER
jgi:transcriptional regulator with XRE-family HTH domain